MESHIRLQNLNDFEIRCITNDFANFSSCVKDFQICDNLLKEALNHIFECFVQGNYGSVLQMNLENYGFSLSVIDIKKHVNVINDFLCNSSDSDRQIKEFILIFIGISAMQEFVRCNFCGPRNEVNNYFIISKFLPDTNISDSEVSALLSLDGEPIYSNVVHPKLLYISNFIMSRLHVASSLTQKWWLLRSTFLHQSILPERNETLHKILVSLISNIYQMDWLTKEENISMKLIFATECCHIFLYYGEILQARKYITDAQVITGLDIELSGALGKRTQYQEKPVAQLFVKLKRNHLNFKGTVPHKNEFLPSDLHLQDDTLLNKVTFIDSSEQVLESLCAEEQIVLLGYCCLVHRSGSFHELLQEELMSYISCLLSQPQVWIIYLKALVMRCKVEKNSSRRIERAVMQMEAIVDSVKKPKPPLKERIKFFYCASFPALWMLEKELADLLLSIGCVKSALEVYERLELWEDILQCYFYLGRTSSAEKIIREQLEKDENPRLWCLLGDVTENVEHYLTAWELSNHRSARAQRSLGCHYFQRKKEYVKCLPYFLLSLEINHLQPQIWFLTGRAALKAGNFELAIRAFRQVVMFDEDYFDAWFELAIAYMRTEQKHQAWRSLQEALKCNYEDGGAWENFLFISTDIGAFEDALRAWHRLLDIKGKHCDTSLLGKLVNAINEDLSDVTDQPSSRLKKRALELLGRITSITTNEPKVWELYSSLICSDSKQAVEKDTLEKAVLFQQKAVRCYNQKGSWERDFNLSKEVLTCSLRLAELSLKYIKLLDEGIRNQQKTSTRLNLQSVISRSKKFMDFFPDVEKNELNITLDSLQEFLNKILDL